MENQGFLLGIAANVTQLAGVALFYGEPNARRRSSQVAGIVLIVLPCHFAVFSPNLDFYLGCLAIPGLIGNVMFLFGIGISGPKAPLGGALLDAICTFLVATAPTLLIALAQCFERLG